MQLHFLLWAIGVPAIHMGLIGLFRAMRLYPEDSRGGTRRSDILAYELVSGLCCMYFTIIGVYIVLLHPDYLNMAKDPISTRSAYVEKYLLLPMILYQCWNGCTAICFREFRTYVMIGHHAMVVLSCYVSMVTGTWQYFFVFFCGIAELTNIPLTLYDMFKVLPEYKTSFNTLYQSSRLLFSILFIGIRLIWWHIHVFQCLHCTSQQLWTGQISPNGTFLILLGVILSASALQIVWGVTVIRYAREGIGSVLDTCRTNKKNDSPRKSHCS
jgi:hypothetical protein